MWFATPLAYVTPNPTLAAAPHESNNKTVLSLSGKKVAPWQMHRSRNEVLPRLIERRCRVTKVYERAAKYYYLWPLRGSRSRI
jgi:hypothetical protein